MYEILFKRYLLEKYHTYHFISKSEFHDFVFIVSWSCVWIFIQKIPPWEIWHVTLQFQIKLFQFCAYCWLKLVWNFIQKVPPWEIWLVTLQFKITISWIFACFCWNWVWSFIQKIPPWELWYKPLQFQITIYQFGAYFGLKLNMKFYSNETSLRNMIHNTSIPNQIFSILCLLLAEISMKFHSKDTSLRNMTNNTSIPNQNSTIYAYC